MGIQRSDGGPEHGLVMAAPGVVSERPPPSWLQIQPTSIGPRGGQAERCTSGSVALPNMGEAHPRSLEPDQSSTLAACRWSTTLSALTGP